MSRDPFQPPATEDASVAPQRIIKVRRDYNSWVGRETMEDYALRSGMAVDDAARWLSPNLADDARG